jgi:hypothetical protein
MDKPKLSAKQVLADIRAGMDDSAMMEKYGLSPKGLQSLFAKLLGKGVIDQSEIDRRAPVAPSAFMVTDEMEAVSDTPSGPSRGQRKKRDESRVVEKGLTPKKGPEEVGRVPGYGTALLMDKRHVSVTDDMEVYAEGVEPPDIDKAGTIARSQAGPRADGRKKAVASQESAASGKERALLMDGQPVAVTAEMEVVAEGAQFATADKPDGRNDQGVETSSQYSGKAAAHAEAPQLGEEPASRMERRVIAVTADMQILAEGSEDHIEEQDESAPKRRLGEGGVRRKGVGKWSDARLSETDAASAAGKRAIAVTEGVEVVAEGAPESVGGHAATSSSAHGEAAEPRKKHGKWSSDVLPGRGLTSADDRLGIAVSPEMEVVTEELDHPLPDQPEAMGESAGRARIRPPTSDGRWSEDVHSGPDAPTVPLEPFQPDESAVSGARRRGLADELARTDPRLRAAAQQDSTQSQLQAAEEEFAERATQARSRARPLLKRPTLRAADANQQTLAPTGEAEGEFGEAGDARFALAKHWYDRTWVVIPLLASVLPLGWCALLFSKDLTAATGVPIEGQLILLAGSVIALPGWYALSRNNELSAPTKVSLGGIWILLVCTSVVLAPRSSPVSQSLIADLNAQGNLCNARLTGWRQNILRVDWTIRTDRAQAERIVDKIRALRNELYDDGIRYVHYPNTSGTYNEIDFENLQERTTEQVALPWFREMQSTGPGDSAYFR